MHLGLDIVLTIFGAFALLLIWEPAHRYFMRTAEREESEAGDNHPIIPSAGRAGNVVPGPAQWRGR